jgi:hypothetical protein
VGVKRKEYLLAVALAAVLIACPNPASPPANNPPTATFPSAGYLVSGSLTPDATGVYTSDGIFNGYLKYRQDSGTYFLFRFAAIDDSSKLHWGLDSSAASPINTTDSEYYAGIADKPPDSGWGDWAAGTGSGTPLVQKLPISGRTEVGYELTPHYTFLDADADAEGGTTFAWYRFDTSTDTTLGTPIATTLTYTTVDPDDNGKYLRVRVTPVDEHGATGTPVLSPPVLIGTNNPPEAVFPTWDFEVQGAGTAAFDGGYVLQAGLVNDYPWYQQEGGSNVLFNFQAIEDSGVRHWGLHSSSISGPVSYSQVTYYSPAGLTPPATGWATAVGAGTPPTVTSSPFTGSTVVPGGTLTVQYVFTDPDGDAEGASTFQWYSSPDNSIWTELTGETSASYTTVSGDVGLWLRVQVTPVDEFGAAGSPVLSDSIQLES